MTMVSKDLGVFGRGSEFLVMTDDGVVDAPKERIVERSKSISFVGNFGNLAFLHHT